nr:hypothetical protein [bacterium]
TPMPEIEVSEGADVPLRMVREGDVEEILTAAANQAGLVLDFDAPKAIALGVLEVDVSDLSLGEFLDALSADIPILWAVQDGVLQIRDQVVDRAPSLVLAFEGSLLDLLAEIAAQSGLVLDAELLSVTGGTLLSLDGEGGLDEFMSALALQLPIEWSVTEGVLVVRDTAEAIEAAAAEEAARLAEEEAARIAAEEAAALAAEEATRLAEEEAARIAAEEAAALAAEEATRLAEEEAARIAAEEAAALAAEEATRLAEEEAARIAAEEAAALAAEEAAALAAEEEAARVAEEAATPPALVLDFEGSLLDLLAEIADQASLVLDANLLSLTGNTIVAFDGAGVLNDFMSALAGQLPIRWSVVDEVLEVRDTDEALEAARIAAEEAAALAAEEAARMAEEGAARIAAEEAAALAAEEAARMAEEEAARVAEEAAALAEEEAARIAAEGSETSFEIELEMEGSVAEILSRIADQADLLLDMDISEGISSLVLSVSISDTLSATTEALAGELGITIENDGENLIVRDVVPDVAAGVVVDDISFDFMGSDDVVTIRFSGQDSHETRQTVSPHRVTIVFAGGSAPYWIGQYGESSPVSGKVVRGVRVREDFSHLYIEMDVEGEFSLAESFSEGVLTITFSPSGTRESGPDIPVEEDQGDEVIEEVLGDVDTFSLPEPERPDFKISDTMVNIDYTGTVSDVLRTLALQAGVGMIFDQSAQGGLATIISLSLPPVSFDDALDVIVRSANLEYRVKRTDSGIPIVIVGERQAIETRYGLDVIKILQIDYADPFQVATILTQLEMSPGAFAFYSGPQGGTGGGGFGGGS